jgi:hypothetical protein
VLLVSVVVNVCLSVCQINATASFALQVLHRARTTASEEERPSFMQPCAAASEMEFFGDLSSYNAAATRRVTTILNSLDQMLYRIPESHGTKSTKVNADDARARSVRNPLLLMFRRACE